MESEEVIQVKNNFFSGIIYSKVEADINYPLFTQFNHEVWDA